MQPTNVLLARCVLPSVFAAVAATALWAAASNENDPNTDERNALTEANAEAVSYPEAGYVLPLTGQLTDHEGKALADGDYRVICAIYSSAEIGAEPDCVGDIAVKVDSDGRFATHINLERFDRFDGSIVDGRLLYLGLRVQSHEGKPLVESAEMFPRIAVWPVLFAKNSGRLSNHTWDEIDTRLRALERKTQPIADPAPEPPAERESP